jgi:O-antigen ligase
MLAPPHFWLLAGILCWMAYVRGGRARHVVLPAIVALAAITTLVPRNHECNVTQLLDAQERGELYKLEIPDSGGAPPASPEGAPSPQVIVKKRWLEWQPALAMLAENLPLGTGAGSYQRNIGEAQYYGMLPNVKKAEPDTANLYLVVGASMGLAGLVSLIAFLLHFWAKAVRLWLAAGSPVERGLAAGLQGALVGIVLANIFTSLFVRGVSIVWAVVLAMVTVVARATTARPR